MTHAADDSHGLAVVEDVGWLRVDDPSSPGTVRRRLVELAHQVGFSETRTGEVGIVATELATNLVKHARDGAVLLRLLRSDGVGGVEIVAVDSGPGMRDPKAVFADGRSTAGTLGIGLGAVARLSSRYDVHSTPGHGTVVTATLWPTGVAVAPGHAAGLTRVMSGEEVCGDAYAVRTVHDGLLLMVADGLGHGPLAARASSEAVRVFRESTHHSPAELLRELHRALQPTRGAAIAIGHLQPRRALLTYAGIGNIAGRLVDNGVSKGLVSHPGIVGHHARVPRSLVYDVTPTSYVVMHSDGVRDRWDTAELPGLLNHTPLVVAASILRDAGVRPDDASVLVAQVA